MKSTILSLGYNCTLPMNVLRRKNYLVPSITDYVQLDIEYLIKLFKTDFDLSFIAYRNNNSTQIIDYRAPNLGNLFTIDMIKYRNAFTNMTSRWLQMFKNNDIKKILIYHANPIAENIDVLVKKIDELIEVINTKVINYDFILVITCKDHKKISDKIANLKIKKYMFIDNNTISGNLNDWDNLIDELFNANHIANIDYIENITNVPFKHLNVAVLISGEWRVNQTGFSKKIDSLCAPQIKKNTYEIFKYMEYLKYDTFFDHVDTFISTDNLDVDKTFNFYGNVKSIYLAHNNTFHGSIKDTNNIIPNKEILFENIENRINQYDNNLKMHNSVHQWYRLLICKNMMLKNETEENIKYDLIIRIRPDITFRNDLSMDRVSDLVKRTISGTQRAYMDADFFAIGTRDLMLHYCDLIEEYGKYIFTNQRYDFDFNGIWYKYDYYNIQNFDKWVFSPEIQLTEHLLKKYNGVYDVFKKASLTRLSTIRK